MGYRRTPFAPEEWYHCFNRGIDKRVVFKTPQDFKRFQELLYLANDTQRIERGNFYHLSHEKILHLPRTTPLVGIGAYCLMYNHFHLLLKEIVEGGISKFMHKIGTGYTSYFNQRNDRVGNLLIKPFRSKHIDTDRYLKRVVQYIHFNPAEIFEPGWKKGRVRDFKKLESKLLSYEYSSLYDQQLQRPESSVLDKEVIGFLDGAGLPPLRSLLTEAAAYYEEIEGEF